jgi:demethylmenaquinone methyltransferase/2-methoxy-6-polyprenyl-1,4-benzoquinol methylase
MTYYDEISEGYEELHKEEQLKKVKLISKHLKTKKSDKLLDVGCGTGLTTESWPCKRYGIDPAKKLLEKAVTCAKRDSSPDHDEIEYKPAPAENIPYKDNFFDIVISITAIQNFQDIEKGLKEIKRVGKDRFVLTFLKKSKKKDTIDRLIKKLFKIEKILIQEKDLIYFCKR